MNPLTCKYKGAAKNTIISMDNERGVVLIIVLVMLLLLTILGTTVLTSSTTDIRLAGNYRNQEQAFFLAQGALEHAVLADTVLSGISDIGQAWTGSITFNGNATITVATNAVVAPGVQNTAQVRVEFVASGTPPRGEGVSAESFVANYYDVDVTGQGANNSEVEVSAEVYKLQAKQ